jgi:hypothetical protein
MKVATIYLLAAYPQVYINRELKLAYFALLRMGFTRKHITMFVRALLPHVFTLTQFFNWAVYFLWHFP